MPENADLHDFIATFVSFLFTLILNTEHTQNLYSNL